MKTACLLILLISTACEKEIEIDKGNFEARLVVNSLIDTANFIQVQISKTSIMNDTSTLLANNAQVELWQNDLFVEQLDNVDNGIYKSKNKPQIAVPYRLVVSSPGFETVNVLDTIPEPVQISNGIIIAPAGTDVAGEELDDFTLTFTDPPNVDNYYEIILYSKSLAVEIISATEDTIIYGDTTWNINRYSIFSSDDPILIAEGDLDYHPRTMYFSDKLFKGQETSVTIRFYSFNASHYYDSYPELYEIKAVLRSVSYAYYQYKKTWWRHLYNQGVDLDIQSTDEFRAFLFTGEPVNMYSNVENGYGIFAGFSESSIVLERIVKK